MIAPRAGDVIAGKYRVVAELGRGGMGVVLRASQLPMQREVALKLLRPELALDARARARFEREARLASALAHPGVVTIFDFGLTAEGAPYLAMELVEGRSLRAIIEDAPDVARVVDLATQLADVLAAAHAAGLVHRDVTPENVLVEAHAEGPRARVLDFGLAFDATGLGPGRMTREGVVMGTPAYLSPEQARGEAVGPPTDVYALGCVLHELLSGRPPFGGAELDVLTKQMFAPPPPITREREVPVALDELRRAMLDKRAAQRPSAAEVRDRLISLDPDPARARARARVDGYLGPRAARMIEAGPADASGGDPELEVGIVGALEADVLLALRASSIVAFVVSDDEPIGDATAALVLVGADERAIAVHAASGRPVVVLVSSADASRLPSLLRAGAADVLRMPFVPSELARRLRRVSRDAARRARP